MAPLEMPVAKTRLRVDRGLAGERGEQCPHEGGFVHPIVFGGAATVAGVPSQQSLQPAGAVGIDDHEAGLVGFVVETRVANRLLRIRHRAVKDQHHGQRPASGRLWGNVDQIVPLERGDGDVARVISRRQWVGAQKTDRKQ